MLIPLAMKAASSSDTLDGGTLTEREKAAEVATMLFPAEDKGKQKAAEGEAPAGPKTPEEELEAEARRAARDRLSGWMRLRLEALLLLETVLSEAEGRYASVPSTAQQHTLAAVQEDLRQVCASANANGH